MEINILVFLFIFFSSWIALRPVFIITYDPLLFIILHSSLVLSSVYWISDSISLTSITQATISHIYLLLGILLTWKVLARNSKHQVNTAKNISLIHNNNKYFIFVVVVFLAIVACLYVVKFMMFGFPLLSDRPELEKLTFTKGGFGIISRIESALFPALCALTFYLTYDVKRYRIIYLLAVTVLCLGILSGGKSILLSVLIYYLIFLMYLKVNWSENIKLGFVKTVLFSIIALACAFLVLLIAYPEFETAQSIFIERITTAPGLGLTTYIENSSYFDNNLPRGFLAYIWNYFIVTVFAPLRLVEYEPTLARELGRYITGGDDFGPNPSVYLEGLFYFGSALGVFYCFFIGSLISIIRFMSVKIARNNSIDSLLLFVYLNIAVLTLTTDFLVFMAQLTSYIYLYALIYIFMSRIKISKYSYSGVQNA